MNRLRLNNQKLGEIFFKLTPGLKTKYWSKLGKKIHQTFRALLPCEFEPWLDPPLVGIFAFFSFILLSASTFIPNVQSAKVGWAPESIFLPRKKSWHNGTHFVWSTIAAFVMRDLTQQTQLQQNKMQIRFLNRHKPDQQREGLNCCWCHCWS